MRVGEGLEIRGRRVLAVCELDVGEVLRKSERKVDE
jgi:hypothetical protein